MSNYLLSREQMEQMTEQVKQRFATNVKTGQPFLEFGVNVLYNNIKKKPIRYRAFGMYWWALKDLFVKYGLDFDIANFGQEKDDSIKEIYSGFTDEQTIVIAEVFFDEVRANYIEGNNQYMLNTQGEIYTLYDEEMESLIL